MTYIVVSSNEIVKAEMERPENWIGKLSWRDHLASLPRIHIHGKHNWKVWQEVVEGRDVEFDLIDNGGWQGQWVAIPIEQPTLEPVKIKNMTVTEKKQPSFGVNDDVYILDTQIYDTPTWIHGVVEEVGDESILVKWDDLSDPTEYQISDMPDIRHREPTPEGEKVGFSRVEMKKVQDDINSVNAGVVIDKAKLLGFPCDINELCDVLQNTCQLLNGIKPDAVEEKWWSDWDESVLESLVKMLQQVQPFYKKQPTPQR